MEDRDTAFWEEQYRTELAEPFDWLFEFYDWPVEWWDRLLHTNESPGPLRVLLLGCGHASLSADLSNYLNQPGNRGAQVISVDSSTTVIEYMREAHPNLEWHVADCRDLCNGEPSPEHPFRDASFDLVIDKALLDAILVYRHVGGRHEAEVSGAAAAREAARVLRPGGKFILFSCLRDPAEESLLDKDGIRSKGADGYGGGGARPYACVRGLQPEGASSGNASPYWQLVTYEELQNPRRKNGRAGLVDNDTSSGQESNCGEQQLLQPGHIAPQFDDVCPTHYGLIVAQKGLFTAALEEAPKVSSLQAGSTGQPAQPDNIPAPQIQLIDYDDPSLRDYDDFYSGRLLAPKGEIPVAPDAHDAFLAFEDLEQPLAAALDFLISNYKIDAMRSRSLSTRLTINSSSVSGEPKARVLDVGMGSSAVGMGFVERFGFEYVGVDVIPDAVSQQQRRYPSLKLAVADARTLREDLEHSGLLPMDSSDPHFDLLFDKGTADALLLFNDPDAAIELYARQAATLLTSSDGRRCGAWVIVTCLRQEGGILNGQGRPRLLSILESLGWELYHHHLDLKSKQKGGSNRTYDTLTLLPPSS